MKRKLIFLLFGLISFNLANAQFAENNAIYATGELSWGNYVGLDVNLNYVLNEKYSFKLGYSGNLRKPKSQPEDFTTGVVGILVFGMNSPTDSFENFGATVGRIYKLNQSGTIRANLSLGVGYTLYKEPENWTRIVDNTVSLGENYSYDKVKRNAVSLIVNPKIEFPITRYFGFTVSPLMQVNKDRTCFGIGIGTMFGLCR